MAPVSKFCAGERLQCEILKLVKDFHAGEFSVPKSWFSERKELLNYHVSKKLKFLETLVIILTDILNFVEIDVDKVSAEVKKLLRIKYALEVISDDPLDFKRIEY